MKIKIDWQQRLSELVVVFLGVTMAFYENKFVNLAYSSQYFWRTKIEIYEAALEECKGFQQEITNYLSENDVFTHN